MNSEKLKEISKRDNLIQTLEQKLAEQQLHFQKSVKLSEKVLQEVLNQVRGNDGKFSERNNNSSDSPPETRKSQSTRQVTFGSSVNENSSPSSPSPSTSSSSPNPNTNGSISYPPGYNPRMRRKSVSAETTHDVSISSKEILSKIIPKDHETKQRLLQIISHNILFKHLTEEQLEQCVDMMFEKKISKGEIIIHQGFFMFLHFGMLNNSTFFLKKKVMMEIIFM